VWLASIQSYESESVVFGERFAGSGRHSEIARDPRHGSSRIAGQAWPPPQRQTFSLTHHSNYFQLPNSRICAMDCRGREIVESHSLHTPTRIFENVTHEPLMRMSRVS
jgi:hypothetical protein